MTAADYKRCKKCGNPLVVLDYGDHKREWCKYCPVPGVNRVFVPANVRVRRAKADHKNLRKRREILWYQDPNCHYCGDELHLLESTVDHVIPRSRGGSDEIENLVLSCGPCNRAKGNKMPDRRKQRKAVSL